MRRRPPRSKQSRSSAASDVYKRQLVFIADKASRDPNATAEQLEELVIYLETVRTSGDYDDPEEQSVFVDCLTMVSLSLIHISEPTRPY